MKKTLFYFLLALSVFIVFVFLFLSTRFYPVAKVNGSFVWAGDYYGRLLGLEHYKNAVLAESLSEEDKSATLLSLVYDSLIFSEIERRGIDSGEAKRRVEGVLARGAKDLEEAPPRLYGWDTEEFKKFLLLAQAREDILAEILEKEGIAFNEWILDKLAKADVRIYFLPYRWEEGKVVDR